MSDAWRDTYDAWKLRSPDDELPQEEQPEEDPELLPLEATDLEPLRPAEDERVTYHTIRDLALELGATCEAKGARIAEIGNKLVDSYVHGNDPEAYQLDILETSIRDILTAFLALRQHQRGEH